MVIEKSLKSSIECISFPLYPIKSKTKSTRNPQNWQFCIFLAKMRFSCQGCSNFRYSLFHKLPKIRQFLFPSHKNSKHFDLEVWSKWICCLFWANLPQTSFELCHDNFCFCFVFRRNSASKILKSGSAVWAKFGHLALLKTELI